jgi:hypothetical protein
LQAAGCGQLAKQLDALRARQNSWYSPSTVQAAASLSTSWEKSLAEALCFNSP